MATYNLSFEGFFLSIDSLPEETGVYLVYSCVNNGPSVPLTLQRLLYIGKSQKTNNTNIRKEVKHHVDNGRFMPYVKVGEQFVFHMPYAMDVLWT